MPSTDHTGGLPSYNYTSSRVAFLMPGLILIQFVLPLDFHTGNTFLGIQAVALDNSQLLSSASRKRKRLNRNHCDMRLTNVKSGARIAETEYIRSARITDLRDTLYLAIR